MGHQESEVAYLPGNKYELYAVNTFGSDLLASAAATTGFDNVYVLNLTTLDGRAAQDQLVYTTGAIPNVIPDGGMTAMLLGVGFTGLAFVSRRMRK